MMQRILLSVALCLLYTMPLPAQDFLNHLTVDVGAGFSFPVGSVARHTKMGFNFVASGGPRFDRFTLTLDYGLHYFSIKNSFQNPETNVDLSFGSEMRLWSLTVNPGYEFIKQDKFSSYATGGYGLYNRKLLLAGPGLTPAAVCDVFWGVCVDNLAIPTITGDESVYKGGYNVGGGVTFGVRTKFFIEARYHHMFTTNSATEIIPLTFGIRW
jgi:opacity protein-like surface antigen